jgi:hypothetical protein
MKTYMIVDVWNQIYVFSNYLAVGGHNLGTLASK